MSRPAAYHGNGWQPRQGTLHEDIRRGELWAPLLCNAEWSRLTDVLLYLPGPAIADLPDPNARQHLAPIRYERLREQFQVLVETYERLGVRVHRLDSRAVDDMRHANLLFQRDLFWQTPFGAVIARMASEVRAGEERHAQRTLALLGVPIALTMGGAGVFEGADCLWLSPRAVACGVGMRTNRAGFEQLRDFLARHDVTCSEVPLPSRVQHLLGCLQVIAPSRAMVRVEVVSAPLVTLLEKHGFEVVPVQESREVSEQQAFNFVVLSPNRVLMTDGAPRFREELERLGMEVAATVPISEYIRAAGGLACATGILAREWVEHR